MADCSNCDTLIPAGASKCPGCGATATHGPAAADTPAYRGYTETPSNRAWERTVHEAAPEPEGGRLSTGRAVGGLLVNFFVLPGLGTLLLRNPKWKPQLALALAGWVLAVLAIFLTDWSGVLQLVAFLTFAVAWIWALATSFGAVRDATRKGPWSGDRYRPGPSG